MTFEPDAVISTGVKVTRYENKGSASILDYPGSVKWQHFSPSNSRRSHIAVRVI